MRYQQILLPCPGTSSRYHNTVAAEGNSLLELWDKLERALYADQLWEVRDTKGKKTLTPNEFNTIVWRLKGWAV